MPEPSSPHAPRRRVGVYERLRGAAPSQARRAARHSLQSAVSCASGRVSRRCSTYSSTRGWIPNGAEMPGFHAVKSALAF
jgi:hypothetical protein